MKSLIVVLLFISSSTFAQWHQLSSPPAAGPNSYAASPDGKRIFAATPDGVWQASQIDGPWSLIAFRHQSIRVIADFGFTGQGDILFAASDTALYRSIDSGRTWSINLRKPVFAIAQDGINLTVAIFGDDTVNTVLRSSDLGDSWKTFAPAPPGAHGGFSFLQFYVAPNYYFAWAGNQTLWRLPRTGGAWQKTGYKDAELNSITSFNNNIFVGARGRVYFSTDNGTSWIQTLGYGLDTNQDLIRELAVNGLTMVGGTPDSLAISTDGGRNWKHILVASDLSAVTFIGGNFVLSRGSGLYASPDGLSWHHVPMPTEASSIGDVVCLDTLIFARTGTAVFQSSDRGQTWRVAEGTGGIWQLRKSNNNILALGAQTIWRWRGDHWDSTQTSQLIGYGGAEMIGDTLFFADGGSGIYRSDDRGLDWYKLRSFPGEIYASSMFTVDDTLFVLSNEDHWNLYASTDYGTSWSKRVSLPDIGGTFRSLVSTAGSQMDFWFVSFEHQGGMGGNELYRSNDYGHTWVSDTQNVAAMAAVGPSILASIVSRAPSGVYNISNGYKLVGVDSVTSTIQTMAADDSLLYVGTTQRGLWAVPIAQLPLTVRSEHQVASMPMELYPNPARTKTTLHVALVGRGDAKLEIFNALGETVLMSDLGMLEGGPHDLPIETTWLTSGIYSVRISTDGAASTSRLIVSH